MFQSNKEKGQKAGQHVDNAVRDFKNGKNELRQAGDLALDEIRTVRDSSYDATRGLRQMARDTGERVQHFIDDKRDLALDAKASAERTIRKNPLAATAVAFAGGLVISRLLRRK